MLTIVCLISMFKRQNGLYIFSCLYILEAICDQAHLFVCKQGLHILQLSDWQNMVDKKRLLLSRMSLYLLLLLCTYSKKLTSGKECLLTQPDDFSFLNTLMNTEYSVFITLAGKECLFPNTWHGIPKKMSLTSPFMFI